MKKAVKLLILAIGDAAQIKNRFFFQNFDHAISLCLYRMISDFHCKPLSISNMSTKSASVRVVDTIKKSDSDIWNYRGLELDNGMLCVLISHPTIDKAAASLNVEIGSYADPNEVPGVAHFLEHMLFMGSTKVRPKPRFFICILIKNILLFSILMKMLILNLLKATVDTLMHTRLVDKQTIISQSILLVSPMHSMCA